MSYHDAAVYNTCVNVCVCVSVCVCVCAFMMYKDWYVCVAQVCAYERICIRMCLYVLDIWGA